MRIGGNSTEITYEITDEITCAITHAPTFSADIARWELEEIALKLRMKLEVKICVRLHMHPLFLLILHEIRIGGNSTEISYEIVDEMTYAITYTPIFSTDIVRWALENIALKLPTVLEMKLRLQSRMHPPFLLTLRDENWRK